MSSQNITIVVRRGQDVNVPIDSIGHPVNWGGIGGDIDDQDDLIERLEDQTETSINAATAKTTPHDNDTVPLIDSQASDVLKKITWANIKATLNTYFGGIFAPIAKGVTNGDSHDHNGGDGAQINHTTLSNIGTNTHAQIDTHIADTANPHNVTKTQVGLSNVDNVQQQPLATALTQIAALSPANDDVIQRKAGAWTNRTIAQLLTDILAALSGLDATKIGAGTVNNTEFGYLDGLLESIQTSFNRLNAPDMQSGLVYKNNFAVDLGAGAAFTANRLYFVPFYVKKSTTFDHMGFRLTTAVAATKARCGVYTDVNGLPSTLVDQTGDIDTVTGGTPRAANAAFSGGNLTLARGWYWLAVICDNASVNIHFQSASDNWSGLGLADFNASSPIMYYFVAVGAGWSSLPSSAGAVAAVANAVPDVRIRVA